MSGSAIICAAAALWHVAGGGEQHSLRRRWAPANSSFHAGRVLGDGRCGLLPRKQFPQLGLSLNSQVASCRHPAFKVSVRAFATLERRWHGMLLFSQRYSTSPISIARISALHVVVLAISLCAGCGVDQCPTTTHEVDGLCVHNESAASIGDQAQTGGSGAKSGRASQEQDAAGSHAEGSQDARASSASSPGSSTTCSAGERQCAADDLTVEICEDGRWVAQEACSSTCAAGDCLGDCTPMSRRCGRAQTPSICSAKGEWEPQAPCEFVCSGSGECTGSCRPAERRCAGPTGLTPQACDGMGTWQSGTVCPNLCSDGRCTGACMPGAKMCGPDNVPQMCSERGTWGSQSPCPFVCSGDGVCGGECKPGTRSCVGNAAQTCDPTGHWAAPMTCMNSTCQSGNCVGQCQSGSRTCNGNTLRTCGATGSYVDTLCPGNCSQDQCVAAPPPTPPASMPKGVGESCTTNTDCMGGLGCDPGPSKCARLCMVDRQCDTSHGEACHEGTCRNELFSP